MNSFQKDQLWLIQALRDEDRRRADEARRFQTPRTSVRRAIGTSIVRLGTRVAGEPTYELARSQ